MYILYNFFKSLKPINILKYKYEFKTVVFTKRFQNNYYENVHKANIKKFPNKTKQKYFPRFIRDLEILTYFQLHLPIKVCFVR